MKTKKLIYSVLLALIAAFVSCKGEIGPAGPAGADGKDGVDGNANVIASSWITPEWSASDTTIAEFIYDDNEITADILNNGVVLSYVDWYGDLSQVHSLPLTYVYSGYNINYNVTSSVGHIRWWFISLTSYTPPETLKFRYVIIPSTSVSKSGNSQQEILYNLDRAGIDIKNYYQVMDYFGLDY